VKRPPRRPRRLSRREEDEPAARTSADEGGPATVLSLQRSAGNAAVSALLLRRERKVADDADTLPELGPVLKDIVIDEDTVSVSGRAWYFKNPPLPARKGVSVETRFGGDMAAKDKSREKPLRDGLTSLALIMFGLDGEPVKQKGQQDWGDLEPKSKTPKQPRPPVADLTRLVNLDLTSHGGKDGRYRFTAVATKGTGDKPTEVILIVELIGARRQELKSWGELGSKRKSELDSRFRSFGFIKREPREAALGEPPDDTMTWLNDQWAKLLQALDLIPAEILSGVPGISWARGRGAKSAKGEAGHYETDTGLPKDKQATRRLTIYDDAFKSDDALVGTVAHEIGHAVSSKPAEPAKGTALSATKDFQDAAKADGQAITKYGKTSAEESYAEAYSMFVAEPATMKVMRPKTYEWFEKQLAAARKK
jgi:hypothetical protein